jgi:CheY-like chemotaxis protein
MDRCILLIDDDPDELDIFSEALAEIEKSIVCIQARSARASMNLLKSLLPDYIFLDINMPEINGLKCPGGNKTGKGPQECTCFSLFKLYR